MTSPTPSRTLVGDAVLTASLVRELLESRLVGVLATFDLTGTIHAVPMWYAAEGRSVILATSSHSRKVANLERDSRATLVIHDSRPGFEVCGAALAGTVEIVRSSSARRLVDLVHARYVAAEGAADPSVATFLASDDVALRFHAQSALIWDERESDAALALKSRRAALPLEPTEPRV